MASRVLFRPALLRACASLAALGCLVSAYRMGWGPLVFALSAIAAGLIGWRATPALGGAMAVLMAVAGALFAWSAAAGDESPVPALLAAGAGLAALLMGDTANHLSKAPAAPEPQERRGVNSLALEAWRRAKRRPGRYWRTQRPTVSPARKAR